MLSMYSEEESTKVYPFAECSQRAGRLPGAGYEAIHPELKGVNPEDYPDIHKLAILADVAPYSREYNLFRQKVGKEAQGNTELQIEYEKILNRVKQTRESVIRMETRRFTAPVEEVEGTVESVSPAGVTLKEYPGLSILPGTQNLARGRAKSLELRQTAISGEVYSGSVPKW